MWDSTTETGEAGRRPEQEDTALLEEGGLHDVVGEDRLKVAADRSCCAVTSSRLGGSSSSRRVPSNLASFAQLPPLQATEPREDLRRLQ